MTLEHVIPRWVVDQVLDDPRAVNLPRPIEHQQTNDRGGIRTWKSTNIEVTAKCVCGPCNNGWMSEVESAAKPMLRRMIKGEAVALDILSRLAIANWIALRSLIFRHINMPVIPAERDWLQEFRVKRRPPVTCFQWSVAYDGDRPFYYYGNDITVALEPDNPKHPDDTPHGILMTLALARFAAKVLWVRKGEPGQPDPPGLMRIWPPPDNFEVVQWPQKIVDDVGLHQLSRMYLD